MTRAEGAPVAVIGIGCRFPGGVIDPSTYWTLLCEGRDAIGEIPPDRIDVGHFFDARPATPGRIMTKWGGYLDKLEEFDADFFGIPPRDAARLDPQQRLLLETTWEALEDAGVDALALSGSRTGVFVGQWVGDFENRLFADPHGVDFPMTLGSGRYAASGRISYVLGLRGASLTIDAACSSSLAAVHLAVRSIREGESALAIAGGVNIILQPHIHIAYSQSRMMATDGRCKFGDASGAGYVRSEGAAIVALKRLDQALADGDRIYAVIRGSAVNNDGHSSGAMGRPSRIGQEELLRSAYADAGISPGRVAYVEAHGTGTRAGDPVELGALATVLAEDRPASARAYVGSVKTNFGHTEAAAGIAGLIKAVLGVYHGAIPPSLHFRTPNPNVPWANLPFTIPTALVPWPSGADRIAGVSAYGIGGTNAHVVLEAAPATSIAARGEAAVDRTVLPLSARNPKALRQLASRYLQLFEAEGAPDWRDICSNAATRRSSLEQRAAFVAADRATMLEALRAYASGGPAAAEGAAYPASGRPKIAFVFPGQGAQWTGMGRELAAREPVFLEWLQRCDAAARPYLDASIVEQLKLDPGAPGYALDRIHVIQPVLVAMAIAYAEWLRSIGITPDAVVGHSMGEVGAAYIAGVLDLDQAMRIICRRSALMGRTSGQGAMAMVELSMGEAEARLAGLEQLVSVAVSNSPRSTVISGDPAAVRQVLDRCERDGVFCRLVKVDVASHSPQMESPAASLASELQNLAPVEARVPLYSPVFGRRATGSELNATYWGRNMRQPVRFMDSVNALLADGVTIFVELGPHPVLMPAVQQTAGARAATTSIATVCCGKREASELVSLSIVPAALWVAGYPVEWQRVMPREGSFVSLPSYPWQRERHWVSAAELTPGGQAGARAEAVAKPDEQSMEWLYRLHWIEGEPARGSASVPERWLVAGADNQLVSDIEKRLKEAGAAVQAVSGANPLEALGSALKSSQPARGTTGLVLIATPGSEAFLPLQFLQTVRKDAPTASVRLWLVTRGAQSVDGSSRQRVDIEGAAMWGASRVIAEEHPESWGGLVDLDPSGDSAASASALSAHLLAADGEDQVALRGERRFCLRLAPRDAQQGRDAIRWRPDSACLITGGLGDIGLRVAQSLAEQGVRWLILLGRTPLPARESWGSLDPASAAGKRVAAICALEAAGAHVQTAAVDVADEAQLRVFLERYQAERRPRIRSVIHAAGVLGNQLAAAMTREQFDSVLNAKVKGARLLDQLLPELDAFIAFSSIGAFLAQAGQANYAAANAGIEALMLDRRARGLAGHSIAWGVWENTGLVKGDAGERNVVEMARHGIHALSPERGITLFSWLCGSRNATDIVLPIDWAAFQRTRAKRDAPLYRQVTSTVAAADVPADGAALDARLAGANESERRKLLEGIVRATLGKVLKLAPDRIEPRRTFGAMGLGSLDAMELRNRLEGALGRPLSATLAWNYPTIDVLVAHLAGEAASAAAPSNPETVQVAAAAPAAAELGESLREVATLSDDEALLALRKTRTKAKR